MQNDNVLTDTQILSIAEKHHAFHPGVDEWWEFRDRADVIAFARALLAAHTGQPVADDAAVRGDERAKRKAFTAVFLDVTTDEASEIVNHPKWSAGSWSHALDDRDAARAELARATSSQAHPGQPEPRAEVTGDTVLVPKRVVELLRIINRDGIIKRASELQEVYRLVDAARAQGCEKS